MDSVNRVAQRFHQSGFTVAFFVLGFLTSISEISVMVNSTIDRVPQVSAGNLVGASFFILFFIIPFLAVVGNGVDLKNTVNDGRLGASLLFVVLPILFLLNGSVTRIEGGICIMAYLVLLYFIQSRRKETVPEVLEEISEEFVEELTEDLTINASKKIHLKVYYFFHKHRFTVFDAFKILLGAAFIFVAGHFMVEEVVYFSELLSVPSSIIGILVLASGTNIPEFVVAVQSIRRRHKEIAFGDYLGSAIANTCIFAVLVLLNGTFLVESKEFLHSAFLMGGGAIVFYIFAQSQNRISRKEGIILLLINALFLIVQLRNFFTFVGE